MNCIKINSNQVAALMGVSVRSGRIMLQKIKVHLNKEKHQIVTFDEFCTYFGIRDLDSARKQMGQ